MALCAVLELAPRPNGRVLVELSRASRPGELDEPGDDPANVSRAAPAPADRSLPRCAPPCSSWRLGRVLIKREMSAFGG